MEFNFNFEPYRKKISDELKETRKTDKDGASLMLENERKTDAYVVSREAKIINAKEKVSEHGKKYIEKIITERLNDLMELGYEVKDVRDQIPEHIKIYIDGLKIENIKKEKLPISHDEKYEKEISLLIDKLSGGKYLDKKHPNHVVGAWHGAEFAELPFEIKEELTFDDNDQKFLWVNFGASQWADRQPGKPIIIMSIDNPRFKKLMETNWEYWSSSLFHTNGNQTADISKPEDLEKYLSGTRKKDEQGNEYYSVETDTNEERLLPYMILAGLRVDSKHGSTDGLKLKNLKSNANYLEMPLRWAEISDTIVDLGQGKVYKYKHERTNS